MILDEIAAYIDAQTALTAGTDLFKARLPDTPIEATAVIETGGLEPEQTLGTSFVMERPRIQILTRAADLSTCRTNAKTVWNLFKAWTAQDLTGIRYHSITPLQSPFMVQRDANDRPIYGFNLEIYKDFS